METDFSQQHIVAADAYVFLLPVGQLFFYSMDAGLPAGRPGFFREFDEGDHICTFYSWRHRFPCRRSSGRPVSKTKRIEKGRRLTGMLGLGACGFLLLMAAISSNNSITASCLIGANFSFS